MFLIRKPDIIEASRIEFNDKKSFKLRYIDESVPEPVVYQLFKKYVGNLSLQDLYGDTETFDILIKDIIVENSSDLDVKNVVFCDKTYSYTYLTTYVSVGIPISTYNCILSRASEYLGYEVEGCSRKKTPQYAWTSVGLPDNNIEYTAYLTMISSDCSSGTLRDLFKKIHLNAIGHGNFRIRILQNHEGRYMLHFILNHFQVTRTTDISNIPHYPMVKDNVSNDLSNILEPDTFYL